MKKIQENIGVLKDRGAVIEKEIREKTLGYIITSFGLVAGLAWNDAIKVAIEEFFPLKKDGLRAKFIYAIAITAVVVIISMYLSHIFKKGSKEEKGHAEDAESAEKKGKEADGDEVSNGKEKVRKSKK